MQQRRLAKQRKLNLQSEMDQVSHIKAVQLKKLNGQYQEMGDGKIESNRKGKNSYLQ